MLHLKELREAKGISQAELAKIIGVSASSIGMYEQGRRTPEVETLKKIADYFQVPVDYLIDTKQIYKNFVSSLTNFTQKSMPKDLEQLLNEEAITLNGRLLSDAEKQKVLKIIEITFWDAKEMNKRKK